MDIKEIRKARTAMEDEIHEAVSSIMRKFFEDTGFSPYRISIEMVDVRTMVDRDPHFDIGAVRAHIEL